MDTETMVLSGELDLDSMMPHWVGRAREVKDRIWR